MSSFGDHDSGIWEVPFSGRVRRSAVPEPSGRCQKMARSPSRSDWKTTLLPFAVQIGKRLFPSYVRRRIGLLPTRSQSQITAGSSPLSELIALAAKAMRFPSGEMRGDLKPPIGILRRSTFPLRSASPIKKRAFGSSGLDTYAMLPSRDALSCITPVLPPADLATPSITGVGLPVVLMLLRSNGMANKVARCA